MRSLRWVGLVLSLLIVGVLGGLTAPLPSEATTISIDGQNITLAANIGGTGVGSKYTCEAGYSSCWYLTTAAGATDPIGTTGNWTLGSVTTSNRARLRINDVGGTPATNVDKMNWTGVVLTPLTGAKRTAKVIITHSYITGQGTGDYQFGMGVTGQFDPAGTANVLNDQFILVGTGYFETGTTNDTAVALGRLDKGAFLGTQTAGKNGIVTQTVGSTVVKVGCNTSSSGFCRPLIKFDFTIISDADPLILTDSLISGAITCTAAQADPLIPQLWVTAMNIFDYYTPAPHYPAPTHLSELTAWMGLEGAKLIHDQNKLAKLTKLRMDIDKYFVSKSCAGQPDVVLATDSTSGVKAGLAGGGELLTTCVDTAGTCGTIVIKKTMSQENSVIATFGFTGVGSGVSYFDSITTNDDCEGLCGTGSQTINNLITGEAGGTRIITETGFPFVQDTGDNDHDRFWWTKNVSCESVQTGPEGNLPLPSTSWLVNVPTFAAMNSDAFVGSLGAHLREYLGNNPLSTNVLDANLLTSRQGSVTVNNLAANDTLTCTFDNRLYNDDVGTNN